MPSLLLQTQSVPQGDARSEIQKAVARVAEFALGEGSAPLDVDTINLWVDVVGIGDQGWQERQRLNLHNQRIGRPLTPGRRVTDDPRYQKMVKNQISRLFGLVTGSNSVAEAALARLYTHYNLGEGVDSWVSLNPLVTLRDLTDEGSSVIIEGPKNSGKTGHMALQYETVDRAHQEWLAVGEDSMLFASRKEMGIRAPSKEYMKRLEDAASIGVNNLAEEWWRRWRAFLGLMGAREYRWVTNVALRKDGPSRKRYRYCPTMVDIIRALLVNDLELSMSCLGFDEAAAYGNKMNQNSGAYRQLDELFNTYRKDNAVMQLATQLEAGHLSDTMRLQTGTHVTMRAADDGRYAMYSVKHLGWKAKVLKHVPMPKIEWDTQDRGTFHPNLRPTLIYSAAAIARQQAEADGAEWTHYDTVKFCLKELPKQTIPMNRILNDTNPELAHDIRTFFIQKDPGSGIFLSDRKIVVTLKDSDPQMYADLTEERVAKERKLWLEDVKKGEEAKRAGREVARRRILRADPDDPEAVVEAFGGGVP